MRLTPSRKHYLIDDLAKVLRKPSAAPTITPGEVIALVLNTTQWVPDRPVEDGDMVIYQIIRILGQAGYSIVPTEAKREDDDGSPHQ